MSSAIVEFDLNIYNLDAIHKAVWEYRSLATITTIVSYQNCVCTIAQCKHDIDITKNEFCNYVLALTVQKGAPT